MGRARRVGDLAPHSGGDRGGDAAPRPSAVRSGGSRDHESARDNGRVGPEDGRPVYNALVWQDTRVAQLRGGAGARWRAGPLPRRTGLPLATYFSGLKIRWILDNVAGARRRAEAGEVLFGNIDTYLLWHLTGGRERRTSRDRLHQRQPHPAHESADSQLGAVSARCFRHAAGDVAEDLHRAAKFTAPRCSIP